MAALHSALEILGPAPYSTIPNDEVQAKTFLEELFAKCRLIVDSIPPSPVDEYFTGQARSSASTVAQVSPSSARSEPIDPSHASLQKEWGKPVKLPAKDNPLGIAVYKLSGRDGKGAWFARSSVHEGLSFKQWKLGFEREFPESLAVKGRPGEGNIRGIGGERRLERREITGAGKVEVYQLSAQFPGPTTPRDFVTLLITSSTALRSPDHPNLSSFGTNPRHFMVVSKPCVHPESPPRDGFIRGQYESIEFIRELPRKLKKASSTRDLLEYNKGAVGGNASLTNIDNAPTENRKRGKTISFAESRNATFIEDDAERTSSGTGNDLNPIEWIMITRSDPGGSVPRFLIERGTPSSIVADAGKFVDWASRKEHTITESENEGPLTDSDDQEKSLEAGGMSGPLAGLHGAGLADGTEFTRPEWQEPKVEPTEGLLSDDAGVANVADTGIGTYAPQPVIDRVPDNEQSEPIVRRHNDDIGYLSSTASSVSFASAEEELEDDRSNKSSPSQDESIRNQPYRIQSRHDKAFAKLNERKKTLDENFARSREKESKDKNDLTSKEQERLRRTEEKHKRGLAKQEERYRKEVAKLEAKRAKEVLKEEEKRRKEQDKDEKMRLARERDETRQELEAVRTEREILKAQVGALQKENTLLVARLGKMSEGKALLKEVQAEVASGGTRSRSSSLRRKEAILVDKEATVPSIEQKGEVLK